MNIGVDVLEKRITIEKFGIERSEFFEETHLYEERGIFRYGISHGFQNGRIISKESRLNIVFCSTSGKYSDDVHEARERSIGPSLVSKIFLGIESLYEIDFFFAFDVHTDDVSDINSGEFRLFPIPSGNSSIFLSKEHQSGTLFIHSLLYEDNGIKGIHVLFQNKFLVDNFEVDFVDSRVGCEENVSVANHRY